MGYLLCSARSAFCALPAYALGRLNTGTHEDVTEMHPQGPPGCRARVCRSPYHCPASRARATSKPALGDPCCGGAVGPCRAGRRDSAAAPPPRDLLEELHDAQAAEIGRSGVADLCRHAAAQLTQGATCDARCQLVSWAQTWLTCLVASIRKADKTWHLGSSPDVFG